MRRRTSFEGLLREALAPVEPPADLVEHLESTLMSITEMAADELEAWELSAMRDPRNWVRPAAAVVVGSAAGAALVLLRARSRSHACGRMLGAVREAPSARPRPRPRDAQARSATAEPAAGRARACARERAPRLSLPSDAVRGPAGMATCYRHPYARDRGLLLELRAADLPGLHDDHARGDALPGVREPAHEGGDACAASASVPRVTYALIAINVVVFLAEGTALLRAASAGQGVRRGGLIGSLPRVPVSASRTASGGGS